MPVTGPTSLTEWPRLDLSTQCLPLAIKALSGLLSDFLVIASVLAGGSGLVAQVPEECAGECSLWWNQGSRGGWFTL